MRGLLIGMLSLCLLQGCASALVAGAVGGALIANDERPVSTQLSDTNASFNLASLFASDPELSEQANISAVVINNNVLLIGQAPSSRLRNKAISLVKGLGLGGKIHNQIRIGNPTSFTTRSNDTWITTKVKGRMLNQDHLDITNIKVITENGELFLVGYVKRSQADLAVEVARNTSGVRKVIKVFEYVDD